MNEIFDACKKEIEHAKEQMNRIEVLENNSESYIYDYYEEIKRQVDLRREVLKQKIDDYSDELINSIEQNKLSKIVNQITLDIEKCKNNLNDLNAQFDLLDDLTVLSETFEFDYRKFKENVEVLNRKLLEIIALYQDSLIGYKKLIFQYNESSIVDIFGYLAELEVHFLNNYTVGYKKMFNFFLF